MPARLVPRRTGWRATVSGAGHPAAQAVRASGRVERVEPGGRLRDDVSLLAVLAES
jgi:hypothetical protein